MSQRYQLQRERALALLVEAQTVLEDLVELPEHIEGSPPGEALWMLDPVIGMLTPDEEDTTSNGRAVELVVDNTR